MFFHIIPVLFALNKNFTACPHLLRVIWVFFVLFCGIFLFLGNFFSVCFRMKFSTYILNNTLMVFRLNNLMGVLPFTILETTVVHQTVSLRKKVNLVLSVLRKFWVVFVHFGACSYKSRKPFNNHVNFCVTYLFKYINQYQFSQMKLGTLQ